MRPYLDRRQPATGRDRGGGDGAQRQRGRTRQAAEAALARLVADRDAAAPARREVAIALRQIPDPRLASLLVPLLLDANPRVAEEAMRSVRHDRAGRSSCSSRRWSRCCAIGALKGAAREVLVGYGEDVVDALGHFLRERDEDIWVRRHIPATLARIPSQKSMDVLVEALDGEPDGFLRFKLVSAIDRLRREHPELTFDTRSIEALLLREGTATSSTCRCTTTCSTRPALPRDGLLDRALDEKIARIAQPRVPAARPALPLEGHRRGALGARARRRARPRRRPPSTSTTSSSSEFRRRLMPMLEDMPLDERVRKGNVLLKTRERDVEETLLQLINDEDEVVSAAAIDFAGRHRMRSLADDIEHVLGAPRRRTTGTSSRRRHGRSPASACPRIAGARSGSSRCRPWRWPTGCASVPIFHAVSVDELFRMGRTGRQVRYEPGQVIYQEGQVPTDLYLLLDGRVAALDRRGDARGVTPPAPLGVEEALEGRTMSDTARASEPSVCLQLTIEEARTLLADNTDLVQGLFRWVLDHPAFQRDRVILRGERLAPPADRAAGARASSDEPLKPIDKALVLQRVPLFARVPADEQLALAAAARERDRSPPARRCCCRPARRPSRWSLDGEVAVEGDGDAIVVRAGDALGGSRRWPGCRSDARPRSPAPGGRCGSATRISFDLLGQQPELLQHMFTTLFGARRAELGALDGRARDPARGRSGRLAGTGGLPGLTCGDGGPGASDPGHTPEFRERPWPTSLDSSTICS